MSTTRWTLASPLLLLAACTGADPSVPTITGVASASQTVAGEVFPEVIALPNGFRPEGIASGQGTTLYVGSLADGAIWRGDARTGDGAVLVPGETGRVIAGVKFEARSNRIFAAGAATGRAYVFDATTGATLATYQLASGPTFVNDVVVTNQGAYFTDSTRPIIYYIPFGFDGALPAADDVRTIPLVGDFVQTQGFNANGIDATADGSALVVMQSSTGGVFRVDPQTGASVRIDLGGTALANGDGILLEGFTLFVVQNRLNQVVVVRLSPELTSGVVEETITDSDFRVPTTVARFGGALYLPNARFGDPVTPETTYEIVRVRR